MNVRSLLNLQKYYGSLKFSRFIYQNEIYTKLVNLYVGYKEIELADLIINLENIILAI